MIHIEDASGEATQIAILGSSTVFFRDRDKPNSDPDQVWGPWRAWYSPVIKKQVTESDGAFDPTWLVAANIGGDTVVSVPAYDILFIRDGEICHIAGYIKVDGYAFDVPTDASWEVTIDIGAIAQAVGAFSDVASEPIGICFVEHKTTAIDGQPSPSRMITRNKNDAAPNQITFKSGQVDNNPSSGGAITTTTEMVIRFDLTIRVDV